MHILKKYKTALKIALSLLVLAFLISKLDMTALSSSVHDIHLSSWLIATPLILAQLVLIAFRWRHLVNIDGTAFIGKLESVRICTLGAMANLLFINSIGGIVVRVALAMQHGLKLSTSITASLIDRLFTLAALIIIAALLFSYLQPYTPVEVYKTSGFMLIGLITSGLLFIPLMFAATYKHSALSHKQIAPFISYLKQIMTNPLILIKLIGYSLCAQMLYIVSCYIVIKAAGVDVPLFALLALLPLITLISSIPLGYGGWGVREGAFILGLGFFGVSMETAFLISIQIGMIGILSTVIAGLPFLILQKGDMFKMDTAAALFTKKPS